MPGAVIGAVSATVVGGMLKRHSVPDHCGSAAAGRSRATWQADHQINDLLTDENLDMVERLRGVADELGTNPPGPVDGNGSCSILKSAA